MNHKENYRELARYFTAQLEKDWIRPINILPELMTYEEILQKVNRSLSLAETKIMNLYNS